ncbi:hypothetical protein WJ23_24595 [Burkholderia lata]|nr:hypothetical protein WJ23_24595 [Burkholderia lata]
MCDQSKEATRDGNGQDEARLNAEAIGCTVDPAHSHSKARVLGKACMWLKRRMQAHKVFELDRGGNATTW